MSFGSRNLQHMQSRWRNAAWWPAMPLLGVQVANGMREIPQFAFFLIYLQEQVGLAPTAISAVVAGGQIAGMVTALASGIITARLGSKWVLVCGLALAGMSSLAFQVPALAWVAVLWWIGGAGSALASIGGASYLTHLSARSALGLLAALYALSLTIGAAIGNPLAGVLIERRGFGAFGWAAMALSAIAILVAVRWMAPLHDHATEPAALRSFWSDALRTTRQRQVRILVGMRSLPTLFYGMLMLIIPLLLYDLSGSKVLVAAYGTTTLIVASATQLLAGRAADRWGARYPTQVAYAAIVVSGLGLSVGVGSVAGIFVFGVLGIAAAWALATLMYVWVADGVPKAEQPSTFGLLHAVWSLSMIVGSVCGGWFVRSTPGLPFLIVGVLNGAALFLTATYYQHPAAPSADAG